VTDLQSGNSLIYGMQIEHHPGRVDGKDVTVHTDVGDLRFTRAQYERALLRAKDTESFRMALFEEVLRAENVLRTQGGAPTTRIGAENPNPGVVDQREAGPPNTLPPRPLNIEQNTVTPGGLPATAENTEGHPTPANIPPNYPGEPPDGSGKTVNEGGEPGEPNI